MSVFERLEGHELTPVSSGPGMTHYICERCGAFVIIAMGGELLLFHGHETFEDRCVLKTPCKTKLRHKLTDLQLQLAKNLARAMDS